MSGPARDHALPLSAERIVRLLGEEGALPAASRADFERIATAIEALFHQEFLETTRRLESAWESVAPSGRGEGAGDGRAARDVVAAREGAADLLSTLRRLLRRANYTEISSLEIVAALRRRSLFAVGVDLDLADFEQLAAWRRAESDRRETAPAWFGLKRRTIEVTTFDRFCLFARFKPAAHFEAGRGGPRRLGVVPGGVSLHLFQDVPRDDIEALFPGVQIRMQLFDRALLGVPAAVGVVQIWAQLKAIAAVGLALLFFAGLRKEGVDWKQATAALLGLVILLLFLGRQWSRFLGMKNALHRRLAEHLQACTLDAGIGVLFHLVHQAAEEESAEAILAYAFLLRAGGPVTLAELDGEVERWLREKSGRSVDFEEDDALGKLARLGLVRRDPDGRLAAAPLAQALAAVRERWAGLIEVRRSDA
jgi:uncharacterized protein DUF3754